MEAFLEELNREPVDWRYKGLPPTEPPLALGEVGTRGWRLLEGDLSLPVMVLREDALHHNLELMAAFCREAGVEIAPHGKTTMAPQLFHLQLQAGAWGITAATPHQVRAFRRFGVPRIVLANQLVRPEEARWVARAVLAEGRELLCLVDSSAGVARLEEGLRGVDAPPLPVLVELGFPGGRTGCRTIEEAVEVARAARRAPHLRLAGVEGYEGLLERGEALERFLADLGRLTARLDREGLLAGGAVVTVGGSCHFDRVVDHLAGPWDLSVPVRVVLRSGCYLIHDHGIYRRCSPFGERAEGGRRLRPALELWATVLSLPEPGLAILGFGRRDAPYDAHLPVPLYHRGGSGDLEPIEGRLEVVDLNDQHAYARMGDGLRLEVGDLVGSGISHPCSAFDRWPLIPLVDPDRRVVGAVRTFF